ITAGGTLPQWPQQCFRFVIAVLKNGSTCARSQAAKAAIRVTRTKRSQHRPCGGPATALVSEFAMQNSLSLWERVGVRAAVRGDAALTRASRDLSQRERCDTARFATGFCSGN